MPINAGQNGAIGNGQTVSLSGEGGGASEPTSVVADATVVVATKSEAVASRERMKMLGTDGGPSMHRPSWAGSTESELIWIRRCLRHRDYLIRSHFLELLHCRICESRLDLIVISELSGPYHEGTLTREQLKLIMAAVMTFSTSDRGTVALVTLSLEEMATLIVNAHAMRERFVDGTCSHACRMAAVRRDRRSGFPGHALTL